MRCARVPDPPIWACTIPFASKDAAKIMAKAIRDFILVPFSEVSVWQEMPVSYQMWQALRRNLALLQFDLELRCGGGIFLERLFAGQDGLIVSGAQRCRPRTVVLGRPHPPSLLRK